MSDYLLSSFITFASTVYGVDIS